MGPEHGGGFTRVDDTLPLWIREVDLGHRRHPLEGARDIQKLHAVSGVRRAKLAHHLPQDAGRLSGRRAGGRADSEGGER